MTRAWCTGGRLVWAGTWAGGRALPRWGRSTPWAPPTGAAGGVSMSSGPPRAGSGGLHSLSGGKPVAAERARRQPPQPLCCHSPAARLTWKTRSESDMSHHYQEPKTGSARKNVNNIRGNILYIITVTDWRHTGPGVDKFIGFCSKHKQRKSVAQDTSLISPRADRLDGFLFCFISRSKRLLD